MFHRTKLRAGQCGEIPRAVVEIYTNIKFFYRIKYLNLHEIYEKTAKTRKSARDLKKSIHNQFSIFNLNVCLCWLWLRFKFNFKFNDLLRKSKMLQMERI